MAEALLNSQVGSAVYPSLVGRRVIITGGASGIGAGMVEAFARQGALVAFLDVLDEAGAQVSAKFSDAAAAPIFTHCDLTDVEALRSCMEDLLERMGGCDVLVNNAANDQRHQLMEVTPLSWEQGLAVNLRHFFFAAQAVVPAMQANGAGSIINLGSVSWHLGLENLAVYQTAKAAIEGLTRSLAREVGRYGIRVNAIIPGNVKTPRQMEWYTPEGEAKIVAEQCLDGRIEPVDVAAMALFLASDEARFCTAHNYWVDAGWR